MTALTRAKEYVELCRADYDLVTHADQLLAALVAEIDAAPVVKVRGKVGEFATIVVSHSLTGKRVRLLALDSGGAKGGGNLPPPLGGDGNGGG